MWTSWSDVVYFVSKPGLQTWCGSPTPISMSVSDVNLEDHAQKELSIA